MSGQSSSWFLARGGKRQRLARAGVGANSAAASQPLARDPEVDTLLELWALGFVSSNAIVQIASAAQKAAPRPAMAEIAKLGAHGLCSGNVGRDLSRHLALQNDIARPVLHCLPLLDARFRLPRRVNKPYPIMYPHELVAFMFEKHRPAFNRALLGQKPLSDFWANVDPHDVRLRGHPITSVAGFEELAIPMRLHSDSVPIGRSKTRSLKVVSMSSMVGDGATTWDVKLPLFVLVNKAVAKRRDTDGELDHTWGVAWRILVWSFEAMARAKWPKLDWNGEPFAEKWRRDRAGKRLCGQYEFAWFQFSADMEELSNAYELRHFNSNTPCFRCDCNVTDVPWSDLTPSAVWRSRLFSRVDYYLSQNHPVFSSTVMGLSVQHICLCMMHCMDLGICETICGSTIFLVVMDSGLMGSVDERIDIVFRGLTQAYDALGTIAGERVPYEKVVGVFEDRRSRNPNTDPDLSCKAAQCRHAVPALVLLLDALVPTNSEFEHVRVLMVNLAKFYELTLNAGNFLSHDVAVEARHCLRAVGVHHQYLCNKYLAQHRLLFRVKIKAHMVQHIADDCMFLNPRAGWTYSDEDFMGKMSRIASQCLVARGPLRVGRAIFERWGKLMELRWKRLA